MLAGQALAQQFAFGLPGAVQATPKEPLENAGIIVGEVVGWRMWKIQAGYLQSYSACRTWAPGEPMTGRPTDHGADGVWAFKERGRAINKMLESRNAAYGAVAMWGEIIEHELGYRAEFARIVSLDDTYHPDVRPVRWWCRRLERSNLGQLRERYRVSSFEETS